MHGRTFLPTRLTDHRVARGMTMQDLADASAVSYTHIWRLETGARPNPGDLTVAKLATALGCTVDDLSEPKPTRAAA